jgi:hypothetical protein
LAFASWASSFAALAISRSFWRRSWAVSFATAATCRTSATSAPALRVRGAALARALPPAELRGARRGAVAGVRRVLVRAMCRVLRVLIGEHNGGIRPHSDHICLAVTKCEHAVGVHRGQSRSASGPAPATVRGRSTAVRAGQAEGGGGGGKIPRSED